MTIDWRAAALWLGACTLMFLVVIGIHVWKQAGAPTAGKLDLWKARRVPDLAMHVGLWVAVIGALWAAVGVLGELLRGSNEWYPYLLSTVTRLGFASLFREVLDLRRKLRATGLDRRERP